MSPLKAYEGQVTLISEGSPPLSREAYIQAKPLRYFGDEHLHVSFNDYAQHSYAFCGLNLPQSWMFRKLTAIPQALGAALFQPVYHLVQTAFFALTGQEDWEASLFCVGRDFEEAAGCLLTLVDDCRGSYLVANAQFMKKAYCLRRDGVIDNDNPLLKKHVEAAKSDFSAHVQLLFDQLAENETVGIDLQVGAGFQVAGSCELIGYKKGDVQKIVDRAFQRGVSALHSTRKLEIKMTIERANAKRDACHWSAAIKMGREGLCLENLVWSNSA